MAGLITITDNTSDVKFVNHNGSTDLILKNPNSAIGTGFNDLLFVANINENGEWLWQSYMTNSSAATFIYFLTAPGNPSTFKSRILGLSNGPTNEVYVASYAAGGSSYLPVFYQNNEENGTLIPYSDGRCSFVAYIMTEPTFLVAATSSGNVGDVVTYQFNDQCPIDYPAGGLIPGKRYYLDICTGQLTTSSANGNVFVGVALTPTSYLFRP